MSQEKEAPGKRLEYVLPLHGLSSADLPIAGGKAAHLGELAGAGLPVPGGFCVTTHAFDAVIEQAGLKDDIGPLPPGEDEAGALEEFSARMARAIEDMPTPPAIAAEIAHAFRALGGPVAVRSSATMEDTAQATFAGQHATYLHVLTGEDVLAKVKECWASLWSPQALRYRRAKGLQDFGKMAVLVQRMVEPTVSGVAFTEDPSTGERGQVTVSATLGLGEALVSGSVTPDLYVMDKATRRVVHRYLGHKERRAVPSPTGGTLMEEIPEAQRQALCLSDAQLDILCGLALAVETHFDRAQDVEWAMDGQRAYVLQARPIVRSPNAASNFEWKSPVEGARWRRDWRLGEWLSDPVTPLFASSLLPVLVTGREKQGLGRFGWSQPRSFAMAEPWYCIVNGYFYTRQDPVRTGPPRPATPDPAARARTVNERRPWLERWAKVHLPAYRQRLAEIRQVGYEGDSATAILDSLSELYQDAGELWYVLAPIGFGFEEVFFKPIYDRMVSDDSRPHLATLFSGYGGKTLQSQMEVERIGAEAAGDERIARLFRELPAERVLEALQHTPSGARLRQQIEAYLEEYGGQLFSLDFFFPTLGEQPDVTVTNIRNYIMAQAKPVRERLAVQVRERERATQWVLEHAAGSPEDHETLRTLLVWHQFCAEVREDAVFYFQSGWPSMRRALSELGRRLHKAGMLASVEDIYFLKQDELESAARALDSATAPPGEPAVAVESRRREWAARRRISPPVRIPPTEDPVWTSSMFARMPTGLVVDDTGRTVLKGQAASPGRSRGRARVIRSPAEFGRMRPGDILVAVATSPAWTPLFPLASAVVTETGGGATHCSLVAREYGIPAVMGTGVAAQAIRDGQIITVDGSHGVVYLEQD